GIAATAGHWMWFLWTTFGNPLFPYFNQYFGSPMGLAASYRDLRFIPESWLEGLFFPVVFSIDPRAVGEIVFRDYRILAAYLLLLATPFVFLVRRGHAARPPGVETAVARYLIAGAALSFAVWAVMFAIYRYLIPLEMLAPLVI